MAKRNSSKKFRGPERCDWFDNYAGSVSESYINYHDKEWGVPIKDRTLLFELLCLEGAQAGLSWKTILEKRDAYRITFDNFNIDCLSTWSEDQISRVISDTSCKVVKHAGKVRSVVTNARAVLKLEEEIGIDFVTFIWKFCLGDDFETPRIFDIASCKDLPVQDEISISLSKFLKSKVFCFVGPKTLFAFILASGIFNGHTRTCSFR